MARSKKGGGGGSSIVGVGSHQGDASSELGGVGEGSFLKKSQGVSGISYMQHQDDASAPQPNSQHEAEPTQKGDTKAQ